MIIVKRNINELIAASYNPRFITAKDFEQLKTSLDTFGAVEPAVINMNEHRLNTIIGGHQRLRAAQELGFKDYPCYEVNLNAEQEKELNIRLNKNTGQFDFDKLANEFEIDDLTDWGFDESEFGIYGGEENDIQGVDEINEKIAFQVKCDNLEQLEELQRKLTVTGVSIGFDKFMEKVSI